MYQYMINEQKQYHTILQNFCILYCPCKFKVTNSPQHLLEQSSLHPSTVLCHRLLLQTTCYNHLCLLLHLISSKEKNQHQQARNPPLATEGPEGQKARRPEGQKARRPEGQKARRPEGQKARRPEGQKARRPEGQKARRQKARRQKPEGPSALQPTTEFSPQQQNVMSPAFLPSVIQAETLLYHWLPTSLFI